MMTLLDEESPADGAAADDDEIVEYRGMKMTALQREEYI